MIIIELSPLASESGRCIFAHGGNLTYDRLLASLEGGMPSVMLYNTGGVTQSFGSLFAGQCGRSKRKKIKSDCERFGLLLQLDLTPASCDISY